jgi:hypothetical protein
MNWFKRISMGLDPNAWDMHGTQHRLVNDLPIVDTPFGIIPQKTRSLEDLEKDYKGVHTTQSIQMAAIYANDIATPQDPPVILEITTPQQWFPDIDVSHHFLNYSDWLGYLPYNVKEKLEEEGVKEEVIEDIMDDFERIDLEPEEPDIYDDAGDIIFRQNQRKFPSAVIEYYDSQYEDRSVWAFYNTFILPLVYNQGYMDANLDAWLINQMRFMNEIPDEQVVAIYTFPIFSSEISHEESEIDERGRPKWDYEELTYGIPEMREVWRRPKQYLLFPEAFDIFYHGTTRNRALQALPSLSGVLQNIK